MRRAFLILLMLTLGAMRVRATIGYGGEVYSGTVANQNNTAQVWTITSGIPVGGYAVAYIGLEAPNTQTNSSVADSRGNTWTVRAQNINNSVHQCAIATAPITTALQNGDTITVTLSGTNPSSDRAIRVVYFTGVATASQPDASVNNHANSQTISDTITTGTAGSVICAILQSQRTDTANGSDFYVYTGGNYTDTGSGAQDFGYGATTVGLRSYLLYKITTTAGAYAFGGTYNKTASYIGMAVALKPAGNTYYVDFAGGSDAAAGTLAAPWKHSPGDTNASSTASSTVLAGNDTVIFKGGVEYVGCVRPRASGTLGHPITYDGNTARTFGAGMAKANLSATFYSFIQNKPAFDYITIKGFDIYAAKNCNGDQNQSVNRNGQDTTGINYLGNGDTVDQGGAIYFSGSCKGAVITDNWIHDFENAYDRGIVNAENDGDPLSPIAVPCQKVGIKLYSGPVDCLLSNNTIWAIGRTAIWATGVSNVLSINNNIGGTTAAGATTNKGWFAVAYLLSGAGSLGCEYMTIRGDVIHDGWQYGGDESQQRSHAGDWFHFFGDNNASFDAHADPHDILIDRCFLYSDHVFQFVNGTAYMLLESDWYNIEIRNNLWVNSFSGGIECRDGSNLVVNASTFLDIGQSDPLLLKNSNESFLAGPKAVKLRNNVFMTLINNSAGPPCSTSGAPYTGDFPDSDYNAYYAPNIAGNQTWRWSGVNYTLAGWRTLSGQDAHSIYGSPGLVSIPADGSTSSIGDYEPADGSALIDMGSTISGFSTDYANVSRPRGAAWDIGAYESNFTAGSGGGSSAFSTLISGTVTKRGGFIIK